MAAATFSHRNSGHRALEKDDVDVNRDADEPQSDEGAGEEEDDEVRAAVSSTTCTHSTGKGGGGDHTTSMPGDQDEDDSGMTDDDEVDCIMLSHIHSMTHARN